MHIECMLGDVKQKVRGRNQSGELLLLGVRKNASRLFSLSVVGGTQSDCSDGIRDGSMRKAIHSDFEG